MFFLIARALSKKIDIIAYDYRHEKSIGDFPAESIMKSNETKPPSVFYFLIISYGQFTLQFIAMVEQVRYNFHDSTIK